MRDGCEGDCGSDCARRDDDLHAYGLHASGYGRAYDHVRGRDLASSRRLPLLVSRVDRRCRQVQVLDCRFDCAAVGDVWSAMGTMTGRYRGAG